MALKKCRECSHQVSTKAEACPNCGAVLKGPSIGQQIASAIKWIILVPVILFVGTCAYMMGTAINSTDRSTSSTTASKSTPAASKPKPPPAPGAQWNYNGWTDEMTGDYVAYAAVNSTNTVNFDFPYKGPQYGRLALRTHPKYGKDVIFAIQKGQILCRSYEPCKVTIRFDNKQPVKYNAYGADDGSSEYAFIRAYHPFVENMLKAKTVKISVEIYKQGNPVFTFDVSNFSTQKYLKQ